MEVFRKHWREPSFWKWWWQNRLSLEIQVGAMLVLLALLLGGGWLAAAKLARLTPPIRAPTFSRRR